MKRCAALTLSLWLFGMASSIANNCLASEPAHPGAASESRESRSHGLGNHGHPREGTFPKTGAAAQDHEAAADKSGEEQTDANCRDFCGKVSVSVPAQKSLGVDVGPAGAPLPGSFVAFAVPRREARIRPVRVDRDAAPPIRIRLVRLAL